MKTLIKNGIVLTEYFKFEKLNLIIENGKIEYIGNAVKKVDNVIDATNKIILPGFINSHIHFGECFIRGYNGYLSTQEYIEYAENINKNNSSLKEQLRHISTIISIFESLNYGTTTMVGIRGFDEINTEKGNYYSGYPFMKSEKLSTYINDAYSNLDSLISNQKDNVQYYIFLHSLKWIDEKILEQVSNYFNKNNIFLAIHILETKDERDYIKKKYGLEPIEVMEKYNLLNERTLLIHGCYLNDKDLDLIKKKNASVCLCPISNLKLKNTIPMVQKMYNKGINLLLGTDGGATNDSFSLIEDAKLLSLLTHIDIKDIMKMFTLNPSLFFKEKFGLIKEGYKADLVFIEKDTSFNTKLGYLENLIFRGQKCVSDVIINGELVIENYKNLFMNEKEIIEKKEKLLDSMIEIND